uniref:PrsW family intramembrane metalloprotease n=1 Tax=Phaeomonas parva TaxID=124430 RepID=A0A7S1UKN1_9STRA|mmetsp:Transcript_9761/g.28662  ORF Transcript_9761/g.28662 Transcript_9761/m.28662 type:complete len:397 (+) Transcript_9761:1-1191(+)
MEGASTPLTGAAYAAPSQDVERGTYVQPPTVAMASNQPGVVAQPYTVAAPADTAYVATVVSPMPMTHHSPQPPQGGDGRYNLVVEESEQMFDVICKASCKHFCTYFCVSMLGGLVASIILAFIGLGVVAVFINVCIPAAVISYFAHKWYEPYVTRCSMHIVFIESAFLIAVPLTIIIIFVDRAIGLPENCEGDWDSSRDVGALFVQPFLRAGLLEETVKFLSILRISDRPYVTDARAIIVYATLAGAAFGVVENIGYGLMAGWFVAWYRGFLTVFAHATTGLLMGTSMAERRFVEGAENKWPFYKVLLIPVLGHGFYDWFLFVGAAFCNTKISVPFTLIAFGILIAGMLWTRKQLVRVTAICPQTNEDVHAKIESGEVNKPCLCAPGFFDCCGCCY